MNWPILLAILISTFCSASTGNDIHPKDGLLEFEDSVLIDLMEYQNYYSLDEEYWSSWCDPQLGCLSLTPDWTNSDSRLLNLEPWQRHRIMTKFSLHTREAPSLVEPVDKWVYLVGNETKTITGTTFKTSRPTKILIHGFTNTGYEQIFKDIVTNLLKHGDYNVIVTHWGPGAGTSLPFYFQAYSNTRVVGLEIAFLVNSIMKNIGGFPKDYHIIGHSLGGHIAGYAGEKITNLGRITGLDPAGPAFAGMGTQVCLDPTDAQFVDVLHTNGGFLLGKLGNLGTLQPMGHLDFYPNGGNFQPGCDGILNRASCSHSRARELFRDSLVSSCSKVAYECNDDTSFQKGMCKSCGSDHTKCAPVGMQSISYPSRSRSNVKLFYATSGTSPFCQYQYAVDIPIASPNSLSAEGFFTIAMSGALSSLSLGPIPFKYLKSTQSQIESVMLTSLKDIGTIQKLTLFWVPKDCQSNDCNLLVKNVAVSALNDYSQTNALSNQYVGCPNSGDNGYVTIKPKTSFTFSLEKGVNSCKRIFV